MNYRLPSTCESSAEYESDQELIELAGHQRDPSRLQLNLFDQKQSEASPTGHATRRVLGGVDDARELDKEKRPPSTHYFLWVWVDRVSYCSTEAEEWGCLGDEATLAALGRVGRKRSRYIPKAKYADVEHSVYGMRSPIWETLKSDPEAGYVRL